MWTYEYVTQAPGETEVEYYFTSTLDKLGQGIGSYEQWVEFEHGLTEHWDVGLYQMFEQKPGDGYLRYDGWKLRTRYRVSERGVLPVDPLVYLEYIEETGGEREIEGKLVLGRDIGKVNISANGVEELGWEGSFGEREWEWKVLLASNYEFAPAFKLGAEGEVGKETAYVGPAVSFASGHNWFTLGSQWGLTKDSADFRLRFLIGLGL